MGSQHTIFTGFFRLATFAIAFTFFCNSAFAQEKHFRIDLDSSEITAAVPEPISFIQGDAVGKFRMTSCDIYQDPRRAPADGANIWVEAVIDATSYHSGSSLRDNSVKNTVLEVQKYPAIIFKGGSSWTDVRRSSETAGSAVLKGELTLHGEARPFEVPVQVSLSGDKLIADGEVTFDYTDFGIQQPALLGFRAGNIVKMSFHAVATRAPQGL
jgi:polyisoprenoid-binding protein YceI